MLLGRGRDWLRGQGFCVPRRARDLGDSWTASAPAVLRPAPGPARSAPPCPAPPAPPLQHLGTRPRPRRLGDRDQRPPTMSQRFVVTPAAAGAGDPYPTAALEPLRVDALPILRYGREPGRYGRWRDPDVPFAARGRPGRRAQSDRGSLWGGAALGALRRVAGGLGRTRPRVAVRSAWLSPAVRAERSPLLETLTAPPSVRAAARPVAGCWALS